MAVSGSWRARQAVPEEYAGATRWGTGINPVHELPDAHVSWTTKEPLGRTDGTNSLPEEIIGPSEWGYASEDFAVFAGEVPEYVANTPKLDDPPDRGQAGAYPSWGTYDETGGAGLRSDSDGSAEALNYQKAVFSGGVSGGWMNKVHGQVYEAVEAAPGQLTVNTSDVQYSRELDNSRAVARGSDAPRSPIAIRKTGIKVKQYPTSWRLGGGPSAPDMSQQSQDRIPFRPFYFRNSTVPPAEEHTWGTVSYFTPVERTLPSDPGSMITAQESAGGYGYQEGDYYG